MNNLSKEIVSFSEEEIGRTQQLVNEFDYVKNKFT